MLQNVEYEPSPIDRVREQVELYDATNASEGGTLNGKPVVVLAFAKSARFGPQIYEGKADNRAARGFAI